MLSAESCVTANRIPSILFLAGAVCLAGLVLAGEGRSKSQIAKPAPRNKAAATSPASESRKASKAEPPRKYPQPTAQQIRTAREQAGKFAEKAKELAPGIHLVETDHFLLYTPWDQRADKRLSEVCEKLYAELCRQFDIPPKENIWVGKCPIYIFDRPEAYQEFCREADQQKFSKVAGYCAYDTDGFVYIVMNRGKTRRQFHELLVHEATHGFLWRYVEHRKIPVWVEEGLAEYMASTLMPRCSAARKYKKATKEAVQHNKDVSHIFRRVGLEAFDYGIAQSLVRFLIAKDRKGFARFVTRMKRGAAESEALAAAHGMTHEDLLEAWREAAAKALR